MSYLEDQRNLFLSRAQQKVAELTSLIWLALESNQDITDLERLRYFLLASIDRLSSQFEQDGENTEFIIKRASDLAKLYGHVFTSQCCEVVLADSITSHSSALPAVLIQHNDLSGLEGGASGHYRHLSIPEYTALIDILLNIPNYLRLQTRYVSGAETTISVVAGQKVATVLKAAWLINSVPFFTYSTATFQLASQDATRERFDLVVGNADGSITVVTGVFAVIGAAVRPLLSANQVELRFIRVTPTEIIVGQDPFAHVQNTDTQLLLNDGSSITGQQIHDGLAASHESLFTSDLVVSLSNGKTFGKYLHGQTVPSNGKTAREVLLDIAIEYINPSFASFFISGQATTVEIGTTLTGSKTFHWSIIAGSGAVTSLDLFDITAGVTMFSGLNNDGLQTITVDAVQLGTAGSGQSWKAIGYNTSPVGTVESSPFTVIARHLLFFGATSANPTDSATTRALPQSVFYIPNSTQILNTGTTLLKHAIALPPGATLISVFDLDAASANITAQYASQGTVSVVDAGGTARTYALYVLTIAVPYPISHRHSFTYN